MRIDYIDGIRGFFALMVVYVHYNAFFYFNIPVGVYHFAGMVCEFFVVSGFVLSYRFWQSRDIKPLTSAAIRRYVRLTLPPLVIILATYLLMKCGLVLNREVCSLTNSADFMSAFYSSIPTLRGALYESLWGMYFSYDQSFSYNPVLWTMETELKGSFLSMAFLALFGKIKNRGWLYLIFIVLTFKTLYFCFVLGMMLADMLYSEEGKKYFKMLREKKFLSWILFFVGVFLSFFAFDSNFPPYQKINFPFLNEYGMNAEQIYHMISASIVVYAAIQIDLVQKFFSLKFLTKVGEYSFSLYLVHFPVMVSVGGVVFLKFFNGGLGINFAIIAGTFAGLLATIPATYLLHHFVDLPSGRLAKRFEKIFK